MSEANQMSGGTVERIILIVRGGNTEAVIKFENVNTAFIAKQNPEGDFQKSD